MNLAVLLFILVVLVILTIFIVLDNRKKHQAKRKTWTQRGRDQHKATKKARK